MSYADSKRNLEKCHSSQNIKALSDSVRPQTSSSAQADRIPSDKAEGAFFIRAFMGNDPAVLFYTSDFLAGTMTMENDHVGMYIRLLCLQHQKGYLTEKDMLYICKTYVKDVFDKFVKNGDKYINKRLAEETEKRRNYCNSRRLNRIKGFKEEITYVEHMENENENENINKINVWFEQIWKKYPKPLGKKAAHRHFSATVKTENDFVLINQALENYKTSKVVRNGFIQHGSTWFNNWRDWVSFSEPETDEERDQRILERLSRK